MRWTVNRIHWHRSTLWLSRGHLDQGRLRSSDLLWMKTELRQSYCLCWWIRSGFLEGKRNKDHGEKNHTFFTSQASNNNGQDTVSASLSASSSIRCASSIAFRASSSLERGCAGAGEWANGSKAAAEGWRLPSGTKIGDQCGEDIKIGTKLNLSEGFSIPKGSNFSISWTNLHKRARWDRQRQ